jgi:ATP-dependent DNA helicase RecG
MARLAAKWKQEGRELGLDGLLVLSYLRGHPFLDTPAAAQLLQLHRDVAAAILDSLSQPDRGLLERKGGTRAATYHLTKAVARDLFGKATYTKTKGLDPIRYEAMVRQFLKDHGSITPKECRELLDLGESQSAKVAVSRLLKKWSGPGGFLARSGRSQKTIYEALPGS